MNDSRFSALSEMFLQHREQRYFPDACFAIFDKDTILYQDACGSAGLTTWFDLASLTKLYTTTAILSLLENKQLALGDSIFDLIKPALEQGVFPHLSRCLKETTLKMLLTHTSGLLPWFPYYAQSKPFWAATEDILAQNPPLQGMQYSDLNFMLLGEILKVQTGLSLEQVVAQTCQTLLHAGEIAFFPPSSPLAARLVRSGLVAVSSYGNGVEEDMCAARGVSFAGFSPKTEATIGIANDGNCRYYWGGISGHAGLFAPVSSLVRLGQFYLNSADSTVFAHATLDAGAGRGLGFEVDEKYPEGCGHTGFTGTSLWISRSNRIGVAILANRLAYREQTPQDLNEFRREVHTRVLEIGKACV